MRARLLATIVFLTVPLAGCSGGGLTSLLGVKPPTAPTISETPKSATLSLATAPTATITVSESNGGTFFTATSSDVTIATVAQSTTESNAFVVSAVAAGTAKITFSDGQVTSTIPVTVSP
jgi:hypothetical protein